MAKLLQPDNSGAAPRRVTLRTSGPAPKAPLRLKGADGKPIEQKKTPAPAKAEPAATPAATIPTPAPQDDAAARAAAAAARAAEEEAARKAAEEEAARKAAEEEAARKAAEEADRLAQEEYERQMAEYEKQMEEYNRQMAEYQAAEEARLAAEAEAAAAAAAPAPAPTTSPKAAGAKTKLTVAKPAGLKPAGAKVAAPGAGLTKSTAPRAAAKAAPGAAAPRAKTAPVPAAPEGADMTEEERAAYEAYEQLQQQALNQKFWQTPLFKVVCCVSGGILAVGAIITGIMVFFVNAENQKATEHHDYINQYLALAADLNSKQIESLADVRQKGVNFTCPPEAAADLMGLVVNPFVKNAKGRNVYGGDPKGVALNACLVLGIAAEQNPEIDKMIFATLGSKCEKMDPDIFSWLLQRMSVSNNKGIKGKLKKLAKTAAAKPKWRHKSKVLSAIWSCIGLRVSTKDIDEIVQLLGDEAIDDNLAKTLSICLGNVLDMMDDPAERAKVGDEVFTKLPEKYRKFLLDALGKSLSPKTLEFYKKEIEDPATWTSDGQVRFANAVFYFQFYGSDDIIDYLLPLRDKAADNPGQLRAVENAIQGVFVQNRERTPQEVQRLLGLVFDKINEDTSDWSNIINKTDPDAADFVGKNSPEYAGLMERKEALEKCRKQKTQLLNSLGSMRDFKWVMDLLATYEKDADSDIASLATRTKEKVKQNTAAYTELRSRFKARGKD